MVLHRVHLFSGCLLEYLQSVFFDLSTLNNMWCYPPLTYSHSNWRFQNWFACPTSLTRFGPTLIWFSETSLMILQVGIVSPGWKFKKTIIRFERGFHGQNANAQIFRAHEFVNTCTISSFIICELSYLRIFEIQKFSVKSSSEMFIKCSKLFGRYIDPLYNGLSIL